MGKDVRELGSRQRAVLEYVAAHPGCTEPEAARALGTGTLTHALARLEHYGLLERTRAQEAGHCVPVSRWRAAPPGTAPKDGPGPQANRDPALRRARDAAAQRARRARAREAADAALARVKPGSRQARIIEALARRPGQTGLQVSAAAGLGYPAGALLNRMEWDGLITGTRRYSPRAHCEAMHWHVAPPGHVPPPVPEQELARREARNARLRLPKRAQHAGPLPGAACAGEDTALFFPDPVTAQAAEKARGVCAGCPAREPCLAGALERGEPLGIWGGEVLDHGKVITPSAA